MSELRARIGTRITTGDFARAYTAVVIRLTLLFAVVYGGCAWLTGQLAHGSRLYFDWERAVPHVPEAVYVYFSIFFVFHLPLFTLDEPRLRRLEQAFACATLLAGICFLALNAQLGFERSASGSMNALASALYAFDPPRNLVPSLHVLYAALVLRAVGAACRRPGVSAALTIWFVALAASTLLMHQHHLIDVVTGALAGWLAGEWAIREPKRGLEGC